MFLVAVMKAEYMSHVFVESLERHNVGAPGATAVCKFRKRFLGNNGHIL